MTEFHKQLNMKDGTCLAADAQCLFSLQCHSRPAKCCDLGPASLMNLLMKKDLLGGCCDWCTCPMRHPVNGCSEYNEQP